MATKKTQKAFYKDIIKVLEDNGRDDLVEFCEGRIAVLEKKSANRSKKVNEANESIKTDVLATLEGFESGATVSEIMKANATLSELSNQKVSAMLRQLIADNKVVKSTEGKKSLFALA